LANVEPKLRLQPYRTRPGFEKGGDSANYFGFFVFLFFFAMMKSSRFGPADQPLEPLFGGSRFPYTGAAPHPQQIL
jgi:hypothetical protein